MKTYSVKLRVYRGKKSYDKDANNNLIVVSPNQTMDLTPYNSMEWNNWIKNASNLGYTDGEVLSVFEIVHTDRTERDGKTVDEYTTTTYDTVVKEGDPIIDEIKASLKSAFVKKMDITPETPEQKKIAEMEAEMAELKVMMAGKSKSSTKESTKKVEHSESNDELNEAKKRFEELYKKPPHHAMKLEGILAKIKEKENA